MLLFEKKTWKKTDCSWLIKIHCTNHWIELVVKGALDKTIINECDTFYIKSFALLKILGKIKGEIKTAAHTLNIKHYTIPNWQVIVLLAIVIMPKLANLIYSPLLLWLMKILLLMKMQDQMSKLKWEVNW